MSSPDIHWELTIPEGKWVCNWLQGGYLSWSRQTSGGDHFSNALKGRGWAAQCLISLHREAHKALGTKTLELIQKKHTNLWPYGCVWKQDTSGYLFLRSKPPVSPSLETQQNDPIFVAENLLVLISHTAWALYEGLDVLILGPFLHVLLHGPKDAKGGGGSRRQFDAFCTEKTWNAKIFQWNGWLLHSPHEKPPYSQEEGTFCRRIDPIVSQIA